MTNFIDDLNLIGFWPLNEASGAPYFHNYADSEFGSRPSGISFNMHVHQAGTAATFEEALSNWPGTTTIFNQESGINYTGLQLQGRYRQDGDSSQNHTKILTLGHGNWAARFHTLPPAVAQSGFTVGLWVLPQTNGEQGYPDTTGSNGKKQQAQANALFSRAEDDFGWHLGVSGSLAGGSQFESQEFGGPPRLTGYAFLTTTDVNNPITDTAGGILETPIESGRFTHLAFTYTYIDGTNNELDFYKDGTLQGSRTTSLDLTRPGISEAVEIYNEIITLGGSADRGTIGNGEADFSTGWNHLVSGAYYFNRALSESEMAAMHGFGGMQPHLGRQPFPGRKITLEDPDLLGYFPFDGLGFEDVSRHHRPLRAPTDIGDRSIFSPWPGPYGRGGVFKDTGLDQIVASSGLTLDLASAPSWTIATRVMLPAGYTGQYIANLVAGIGTTDDIFSIPVAAKATRCFQIAYDNTSAEGLFARFYPLGDDAAETLLLQCPDGEWGERMDVHVAVLYDNQTKGAALYLDGKLASSGTLTNALYPQVLGVAGSGFPLMFMNGIVDQPVTTDGSAADTMALSDIAIFSRPLLPDEVEYLNASGVEISALYRSVHDPRLTANWPCDDFDGDDVIVTDDATVWQGNPSHLTFAKSDGTWGNIENSENGPWYTLDPWKQSSPPPELNDEGNLGIYSGVFAIMGGSTATVPHAVNDEITSSATNNMMRTRPNTEDRNTPCHSKFSEWILGFDVTPSGTIRATNIDTIEDNDQNTVIFDYGNAADFFRCYLTTINADNPDPVGQSAGLGGSGVSVVFYSEDGTPLNSEPLASGNVSYGVPNKVMLHLKWDDPYNGVINEVVSTATLSLYIDGDTVYRRYGLLSEKLNMWSDTIPASTSDTWLWQFGGRAVRDAINQIGIGDVGLGEIRLRNIFMMRGAFSSDDLEYLSTSGIQQVTSLTGYSATGNQPTTQVTIADSALAGYYRFNGGVSGERDLSTNANNLIPLAKQAVEDNTLTTFNREAADNLRFVPGPLLNSDLSVRASGITYGGDLPPAADAISPFVTSGIAFQNPASSFSIGFLSAKRDDIGSNVKTLLSYGIVPTNVTTTTTNPNYGWAIYLDNTENMVMSLALTDGGGENGTMYLTNSASVPSGQMVAGAYRLQKATHGITASFMGDEQGNYAAPHPDSYNHWCWTFDATEGELICYMNGELVDRVKRHDVAGGPLVAQNPRDPSARMISMFFNQNDVWDWSQTGFMDFDAHLTDLFYFTDVLTEREVRYIALNGIDAAQGVPTSGIIGGYLQGQDTGSGIVAGYLHGQDTVSGVIGGFVDGSIVASGFIGGFVSGVVFATGQIGAYVHGQDVGSGYVAGYIRGGMNVSGVIGGFIPGQETVSGILGAYIAGSIVSSGLLGGFVLGTEQSSGILGGWILGGLQGNQQFDASYTVDVLAAADFDAMLEARQQNTADFDAQAIIFQSEIPPLVDIIVPDETVTGLVPPFNQYFIAKASGQQGKSIAQTRWTFGDLSPAQTVAESGAGCYPIQHRYATSGIFIAKFEAIDSNGIHNSATRIINVASGIPETIVTLSGVPRSGDAILTVDFDTNVEALPPGVAVSTKLLLFDDGQTSTSFNPSHAYTEAGIYKPVWCVRDSRGFIWCDSLEAGPDQ